MKTINVLNKYKPEYFIETFWESVNGCRYKQPMEYLNGKSLFEYPKESYEFKNWGTIYHNSRKYCNILNVIRANDHRWKDQDILEKTFLTVKEYYEKKYNHKSGTITELSNLEIQLLNNSFTLVSFCALNAYEPGCKLVNNNLVYTRVYKLKDSDLYIAMCFGIYLNNTLHYSFYFVNSHTHTIHWVDNDDSVSFKNCNIIDLEQITGFCCSHG